MGEASLTSKLVMSAPQILTTTHAELVRPALVPRKLMPPLEPRPASQLETLLTSKLVMSAPQIQTMTHAELEKPALVPRKLMLPLEPRPASQPEASLKVTSLPPV